MDFGDTPTTRQTERIMTQINEHLIGGTPHYNRVYEIIHRELLAATLVAGLARSGQKAENTQNP